MTKIVIEEHVAWVRPACDCCGAEPMEYYTATIGGEEIELNGNTSIDVTLSAVLEHMGYEVEIKYAEEDEWNTRAC